MLSLEGITYLSGMVVVVLLMLVFMINIWHYKKYYEKDDYYYDSIEQVVGIAEEQKADALVVLGEDMITTGRVARLCRADMPVFVYVTWGNVHGWGGSTLRLENYPEIENYVILTRQAGYDGVADEIKDSWNLYGVMGDWQIYFGVN